MDKRSLKVGVQWLLAACLILTAACTDIISDAPEFSGSVTITPITSTQTSVAWSPATDDLNETYELKYAIWVAESGVALDPREPENLITDEGVLNVTLRGLEPGTEYEILVRAVDRGGNQSDNEAGSLFTQIENANYQQTFLDTKDGLDGLTSGAVFDLVGNDIGLIYDREIQWLVYDGSQLIETGPVFQADESIQAAVMTVEAGELSDLLVVHATGLSRYENRGAGVFVRDTGFNVFDIPRANTLHVQDMNNDARNDLVFATTDGAILIYEGTSDDIFNLSATMISGHFEPGLLLADIDLDSYTDLIVWSGIGTDIAFGTGDFEFDSLTQVLTEDDMADVVDMLVADFSGDGRLDLAGHRWINNRSDSLVLWWGSNSDIFSTGIVTSLSGNSIGDMQWIDWDRDGAIDILAPQIKSNNAVVFRSAGSSGFYTQPLGLGSVQRPSVSWRGDLQGVSNADVVLVDSEHGEVSVIASQP